MGCWGQYDPDEHTARAPAGFLGGFLGGLMPVIMATASGGLSYGKVTEAFQGIPKVFSGITGDLRGVSNPS